MAVIDASVLVDYVGAGRQGNAARDLIVDGRTPLAAPHLVDAEVGHALRGLVLRGELDESAGEEALADFAGLPLRRASHVSLLSAAWELCGQVSFYDGLYLALALLLDEPLATFDERLARAARKLGIAVVAFPG